MTKSSNFSKKKKDPHLYRTFDDGVYKVFMKNCLKYFNNCTQKGSLDIIKLPILLSKSIY